MREDLPLHALASKVMLSVIVATLYVLLYTLYAMSSNEVNLASESARSQFFLLCWNVGADVEVEDVYRESDRCTRIRYVYDSCNVPLHRSTTEQQVDLVVVVAYARQPLTFTETDENPGLTITSQILNHP